MAVEIDDDCSVGTTVKLGLDSEVGEAEPELDWKGECDSEIDGDDFNAVGKELGTFDDVADPDSVALLVGDGDLSIVVAIIDGLCVRILSDDLLVGNVVPFCSDGGTGIWDLVVGKWWKTGCVDEGCNVTDMKGFCVGEAEGLGVGKPTGFLVGFDLGVPVGLSVGVGLEVGKGFGFFEGFSIGAAVGLDVLRISIKDGLRVGDRLGDVDTVSTELGASVVGASTNLFL